MLICHRHSFGDLVSLQQMYLESFGTPPFKRICNGCRIIPDYKRLHVFLNITVRSLVHFRDFSNFQWGGQLSFKISRRLPSVPEARELWALYNAVFLLFYFWGTVLTAHQAQLDFHVASTKAFQTQCGKNPCPWLSYFSYIPVVLFYKM